MKRLTEEDIKRLGYKVENAKITSVDLSMADHCVLCLEMGLEGGGWGCVFGGHVIGKGYLGADKFEGFSSGIEYLMEIMNVVGVERFNNMKGKYIRVATNGLGSSVKIIGNIIENKWFDVECFFKEKGEEDF